jgi:flagellar basal-body rod modification protein FlgD
MTIPTTFPNPNYTGSTTSTGSSNSSSSSSAAGGVSLGGTDFLTLMLAQLKNQDPTSPIDSNAFLTQLAQLSEVQGINSLNTSFSSSLQASQTLQASSLLGHQVLAASGTATLASGGTVSGAVSVPQNTSSVTLNVLDSTGVVVQQLNLGAQAAGMADFSWDGTEANGTKAPAGTYTLSASVNGVPSTTAVGTYVNGAVESVTMASGTAGLVLNVAGLGSVPFSSVTQISN